MYIQQPLRMGYNVNSPGNTSADSAASFHDAAKSFCVLPIERINTWSNNTTMYTNTNYVCCYEAYMYYDRNYCWVNKHYQK